MPPFRSSGNGRLCILPPYTGETGSHVYRYDAQKEYEKNGESFRFKELMEQAAAQELHEKYPEVFK